VSPFRRQPQIRVRKTLRYADRLVPPGRYQVSVDGHEGAIVLRRGEEELRLPAEHMPRKVQIRRVRAELWESESGGKTLLVWTPESSRWSVDLEVEDRP
jgi:hypothetical protein